MTGSYDILIVGVGGQGTILASNILGEACLLEGKSVRGAETHGMAQRGGSVETHIRIGGKYGPLISPGTADLIISFDLLEALRYSHFLKEGGTIITNTETIIPTSVFQHDADVPGTDDILNLLSGRGVLTVDAAALALEAGTILTQNVVMLGAASHRIPLAVESLKEAVRRSVPPKTVDTNLKAFDLGRTALE